MLSEILNLHPEILSLNELYSSLGQSPFPVGVLTGRDFWRLLTDPNDLIDARIRSGNASPEILYPRHPGRFDAHSGGIPAICLMVLPALALPGDALFDELEPEIQRWPSQSAPEHYLALFDWLSVRFDRRVIVERSGYSLRFIPMLREAFPHARFVHLYRDGPDCALSMSRHTGFRMVALVQEISEHVGLSHQECLKLRPDDPRVPDDLRPVLSRQLSRELVVDRPIPLARFGELWSKAIEEGMRHLSTVPESQHMAIRYEDLLDEPEGELTRLAEAVGVEPMPCWLRMSEKCLTHDRRGGAARLDGDDRKALVDSCASGMQALGLCR
ncbi:MAG: sulfotransferase family protein [Pseudonocardiales bacterium]